MTGANLIENPPSVLSLASKSIDSIRLKMAKDGLSLNTHEIMMFSCYTKIGWHIWA
ncbi:hypothetical protein Brsp04_00421 [Brucella sp. NBRC 12952]|jgi:hypothetical protein|nr:hypothetical protein Brsp01_20660 [Brucella sp. NBRC 12950]